MPCLQSVGVEGDSLLKSWLNGVLRGGGVTLGSSALVGKHEALIFTL
jgi:hypothetical protein